MKNRQLINFFCKWYFEFRNSYNDLIKTSNFPKYMKEKHRKNVLLCNGDGLAAEAGLILLLRPAAPVL